MKHFQSGDLVKRIFLSPAGLYEWWGDRSKGTAPPTGTFGRNDLGIVLEDNRPLGGNGCKVLTSNGQVGWTFANELEVIRETR